MKKLMKHLLVITATLLTSASYAQSVAYAQDAGHLRLTTVVQKEEVVTTDDGKQKTELVAPSSVIPGDAVLYTITFENVSAEVAQNITITNPVPANLTYETGSAFGPGTVIEFSVDGGNVYGAPDELTVTVGDEVRPAGPEDYTHIRWVMQDDLDVGAQGMARFRARLN